MAITLDGTTGVTAAEFDGTVDASNLTGTLPAIDGSALTGVIPPTTFGAVGTYTGAVYFAGASTTNAAGSTVAGSSLELHTGVGTNQFEKSQTATRSSAGLSGTWRCMATNTHNTDGVASGGTLWLRIS